MAGDDRLRVTWAPRATPLAARAAVAQGAAARALGRRLLDGDDERLALLSAVAGRDLLLVLGDSDDLPWVDGVTYLGSERETPALLVPTALAPSVPVAVLDRAVRARLDGEPGAGGLAAVLVEPLRLVPCHAARAIARDRLAAWVAAMATLPLAVVRR
jgi:hypothetical protein